MAVTLRLLLPLLVAMCVTRARAEEVDDVDSKTFGLETQQACISSSRFYNETLCREQDRRFRTFSCSDIPPGTLFSCETQASLDKCFRTWMYKEAFCLRSCGRCGDGCNDITPPGSTECDASLCETDEYIGTGVRSNMSDGEPRLPYCLKTCRRCSVTTTV